jgi:PIN domain nuclease of toxin-antitoxin system
MKSEIKIKSERKKLKAERNYEIFDKMQYKYNTKLFSLKEKHPISKERFDNVNIYIE